MNYACISRRPFITKKKIKMKTSLSNDAKARKEFIKSHNFIVDIDPLTKEIKMIVSEKANEN
mgnify:CR=1 FL=1